MGEGVDFWPHSITPMSLSLPPPLGLLVFHKVSFTMSCNASWREALSSDTKSLLHVRLFLCTHCRVACLAVLKGVGDCRESIVCEIYITLHIPRPSAHPPPPLQIACSQLLLGLNNVFTTCAFPIKHLVPAPSPLCKERNCTAFGFNFSWVLELSHITSKCSKLKWNHELQASSFTTKF